MVEKFDHMNLREPLLRGIYNYGFELPSAIQQQAIKPCISGKKEALIEDRYQLRVKFGLGRDVIAQAQAGTGKTATFAISVLQQLDTELKECQALILAPTRELAQQVRL